MKLKKLNWILLYLPKRQYFIKIFIKSLIKNYLLFVIFYNLFLYFMCQLSFIFSIFWKLN